MTWSRAFDAPIPLPDGGEITTLREAGEHHCLSWEPPQFGRQVRSGSSMVPTVPKRDFRDTPESRHSQCSSPCLKGANTGSDPPVQAAKPVPPL